MVVYSVDNATELYRRVKSSAEIVIVGIFDKKCFLCQQTSARFTSLSEAYPQVLCLSTFATDSLDACRKWNVRKAPSFLFFSYRTEEPEERRVIGGDLQKVEEILSDLLALHKSLAEDIHEIDLDLNYDQVKAGEIESKPEEEQQNQAGEMVPSNMESKKVDSSHAEIVTCEVHDQAYVTLATSDEYVLGALVLAHSLRRTGTQRHLVCMVTDNVPNQLRELLTSAFNRVVEVSVLNSNDEANLKLLGRPELRCTFTKLHCWRLSEYTKCIFLDADMLVLSNIDELFDREELTACRDAGWPDYFNSGLFVYTPSANTYSALVEFAVSHGSFDGGDQGLLNRYFSSWGYEDMRKHLPFIFNCTVVHLNAAYSYLPALVENLRNIRVLHFAGAGNKPWHFRYDAHRDDIIVPGSETYVIFARYWWHLFASNVHQPLLDAIQHTGRDAGQIDELVRRIASAPLHGNSRLITGARIHPHIALLTEAQLPHAQLASFAVPAPAQASFAEPAPVQASVAVVPTAQPQPQSQSPQSSSLQQQELYGPRSFSDIERKLRDNLK